jgi:capsular exopolysaccharide synthesis family protein
MNDESRLQIERYFQLVNRRKWVLVIPVVLAVIAAAVLSFTTPPTYTAVATVRVDVQSIGVDASSQGGAERALNSFAFTVRSRPFLEKVIANLNLDTSASGLKGRVSTNTIADTELIEVKAKAGNADDAAAIANELVTLMRDPAVLQDVNPDLTTTLLTQIDGARQSLADEQARLSSLESSGASQAELDSQRSVVQASQSTYEALLTQLQQARLDQARAAQSISIIEPANPPDAASSPRWAFNLAAGLLAGAVIGAALALVLEYIDPTLRDVRDLEGVTRLPVLASIPFGIRWKYPPPPVSPDYRLLATKLQSGLQDEQRKSVLFTSARPEEGNTTVSTYTAMAMAQAGMRVLLLDANLNRPDLHKLFNLPMSPGLYNFISQNGARPTKPIPEAARDTIQASPIPRLSVLTAGIRMNDPSELLASAETREFLRFLETQFDVVVIDGASMQTSAGSAVIAPVVDGVVVVAAEGQASSRSVEESVRELTSLGAHTIGLVYCKATEA